MTKENVIRRKSKFTIRIQRIRFGNGKQNWNETYECHYKINDITLKQKSTEFSGLTFSSASIHNQDLTMNSWLMNYAMSINHSPPLSFFFYLGQICISKREEYFSQWILCLDGGTQAIRSTARVSDGGTDLRIKGVGEVEGVVKFRERMKWI